VYGVCLHECVTLCMCMCVFNRCQPGWVKCGGQTLCISLHVRDIKSDLNLLWCCTAIRRWREVKRLSRQRKKTQKWLMLVFFTWHGGCLPDNQSIYFSFYGYHVHQCCHTPTEQKVPECWGGGGDGSSKLLSKQFCFGFVFLTWLFHNQKQNIYYTYLILHKMKLRYIWWQQVL